MHKCLISCELCGPLRELPSSHFTLLNSSVNGVGVEDDFANGALFRGKSRTRESVGLSHEPLNENQPLALGIGRRLPDHDRTLGLQRRRKGARSLDFTRDNNVVLELNTAQVQRPGLHNPQRNGVCERNGCVSSQFAFNFNFKRSWTVIRVPLPTVLLPLQMNKDSLNALLRVLDNNATLNGVSGEHFRVLKFNANSGHSHTTCSHHQHSTR